MLTWASNKIRRVVSSTLESETMACIDGLGHVQYLRTILCELLYGSDTDVTLIRIIGVVDSNQLYTSLNSTKPVQSHRLRRDIAGLKEQLETGIVSEIRWVKSEEQLSDVLTKDGACSKRLGNVLQTGNLYSI